eukprot:12550484-Alexandrium_andersonii.AAC.1
MAAEMCTCTRALRIVRASEHACARANAQTCVRRACAAVCCMREARDGDGDGVSVCAYAHVCVSASVPAAAVCARAYLHVRACL